jgi:hypothetical protein
MPEGPCHVRGRTGGEEFRRLRGQKIFKPILRETKPPDLVIS